MCQAVDEMIEDGREEGRMEGFIKAYAGLISCTLSYKRNCINAVVGGR